MAPSSLTDHNTIPAQRQLHEPLRHREWLGSSAGEQQADEYQRDGVS
ncbi:MAG: hypothetical protein ACR2NA_04285 [Solirubrobacterales bacterium]